MSRTTMTIRGERPPATLTVFDLGEQSVAVLNWPADAPCLEQWGLTTPPCESPRAARTAGRRAAERFALDIVTELDA